MSKRVQLDCHGRTSQQVLDSLRTAAQKNGSHLVLTVQNLRHLNDSVVRLLKALIRLVAESGWRVSIVDPSGCAAALVRALQPPLAVEVCASEDDAVGPKRILVVEDHDDSLEFIKTLLESAGHVVVAARDARQALALATAGPLDLILLDLVLPDGDGLGVADELRRRKIDAPMVAVSAYVDRWDEQTYRRAGIRRQLRKPYQVGELLSVIKSCAR